MSFAKFSFVLLGLLAVSSANKCYVLSLEGGGTLGAYEVGALLALTEKLPASQMAYNYLTGISIGSVNSCWAVGFETGDERNMALYLNETWSTINPARMGVPQFGGIFLRGGALNNKGLHEYIVKYTGESIKRAISVSATDYNTGELVTFNESLGLPDLTTACWASTAYPGAFAPVYFQDKYWADGAATMNSNPYAGIQRCIQQGYSKSDIVLDILADTENATPAPQKLNTTRQILKHISYLTRLVKNHWFLLAIKQDLAPRYYVRPSATMPFPALKKSQIQGEIALGYKDASVLLSMTKAERKQVFQDSLQSSRAIVENPHFS